MGKGRSRKPQHEPMPGHAGRREVLPNGYQIDLLRHHYPALNGFQYYVTVGCWMNPTVEKTDVVVSMHEGHDLFDAMVAKYRALPNVEPRPAPVTDPKTALMQTIRILQKQYMCAIKLDRLDRAKSVAQKELEARAQLEALLAKQPIAA